MFGLVAVKYGISQITELPVVAKAGTDKAENTASIKRPIPTKMVFAGIVFT